VWEFMDVSGQVFEFDVTHAGLLGIRKKIRMVVNHGLGWCHLFGCIARGVK
jgi:hypothetical protein